MFSLLLDRLAQDVVGPAEFKLSPFPIPVARLQPSDL